MTIRDHAIEVRDWTIHENLPLIYVWEIFETEDKIVRYVGKSADGHHRPTVAYKEKIEGIRKGPWRAVHNALAAAVDKKLKIRLTLFCNVSGKHLNEMESLLIEALRSGANDGGLNGGGVRKEEDGR